MGKLPKKEASSHPQDCYPETITFESLIEEMSKGKPPPLDEAQVEQWMKELGVEIGPPDYDGSFRDALRDGMALCQLVNVIRPNSVEEVSPHNLMLCLWLSGCYREKISNSKFLNYL